MDDFFTSAREIQISFFKGKNKIDEIGTIESKIIVSTTAASLEDVQRTSNVRIYFFINKDGKESSCFEIDPFDTSITFMKRNKYLLFAKTILETRQEIRIDKLEEEDDLYDLLLLLYDTRNN